MIADRKIVAELTYRSYEYQRMLAPQVSVSRWEKLFGPDVWKMEERLLFERGMLGDKFICDEASA